MTLKARYASATHRFIAASAHANHAAVSTSVAVIFAAYAAAILAGCAAPSSAPPPPAPPPPTPTLTATPSTAWPPVFKPEQMGGTLYRNLNGEPATLNPLTYKDYYTTFVLDYVFESLLDRDPDTLEFRPRLADKWEVSLEFRPLVSGKWKVAIGVYYVYTFHLDPRAKFSDGTPVTADDVVFTYDTMINPEIDCRSSASYFEDCESCRKIDDRTVRFTWKKPYFRSLEISAILVLPKHVYEFKDPKAFNDLNDTLVGSGPYAFKEWKTGQDIALERNENYWLYKPPLDRVVFRFILEEQAAIQALQAGELDELAPTAEWWIKLRQRPEVAARFQWLSYSSPFSGYNYIGWNNERPPFNDKRVRQAMTQLVWREQLLKYMWYDIGTVSCGPFWPGGLQADPAIKPWPYDPQAALALLKEAGWEDRNGDGWLEDASGKRFEFEFRSASGNQLIRDASRVIQEEFRRVGIDMHVRLYEWSVFTKILNNRDFDATMLSWGGGGVEDDPYQIWHSKSIADQGSNHIGFNNRAADRLIETARETLDTDKRNALFHEFHRLVRDEQPYTFLIARQTMRIISPRVKGVVLHKVGVDEQEWWIGKDVTARKEAAAP
jgi:peptide/nickel transport system substrate-binding protein